MLLIRADRLLPGGDGEPIAGAGILLEDGVVRAVGRATEVVPPDGATCREVDYGEATVMPGLIDVHTHPSFPASGEGVSGEEAASEQDEILVLQAAHNARRMLESGVTTARDMGAKHRVAFALREGIRRGIASGPRMVVAGRPITMTGGHMWYYGSEADGVDAVRRGVRELFKEGADYIKVAATGGGTKTSHRYHPSYTVAELSAVVDEAHRIGRLTAAHASSSGGIENCLDAGVDLIAHGYFYDADGSYRYRPDLADRLAVSTWVNPTLYLRRAEILAAEARTGSRPGARDQARIDRNKRAFADRIEGVSRMLRAGVRIVAGSDSPFGWYAVGQFVREIEMLAEAGMTNGEAIRAATSDAAAAVGLGTAVGRLAPGMSADVLVVRGDPLQDLGALWNVLDVYMNGERVERPPGPIADATANEPIQTMQTSSTRARPVDVH